MSKKKCEIGDIVLAKAIAYPFWPAKIIEIPQSTEGEYLAAFFGVKASVRIKYSQIRNFNKKNCNRTLEQLQKSQLYMKQMLNKSIRLATLQLQQILEIGKNKKEDLLGFENNALKTGKIVVQYDKISANMEKVHLEPKISKQKINSIKSKRIKKNSKTVKRKIKKIKKIIKKTIIIRKNRQPESNKAQTINVQTKSELSSHNHHQTPSPIMEQQIILAPPEPKLLEFQEKVEISDARFAVMLFQKYFRQAFHEHSTFRIHEKCRLINILHENKCSISEVINSKLIQNMITCLSFNRIKKDQNVIKVVKKALEEYKTAIKNEEDYLRLQCNPQRIEIVKEMIDKASSVDYL